MAKVVAKKDKVLKHDKSVEIIKAIAGNHEGDIRSIAAGLGYSEEEIDNTVIFIQKLKVVKA